MTSFEENLARLETVVRDLEGGKLTLDEALARFEEGVGLARALRGNLAMAEDRIRQLLDDGTEKTLRLVPDGA